MKSTLASNNWAKAQVRVTQKQHEQLKTNVPSPKLEPAETQARTKNGVTVTHAESAGTQTTCTDETCEATENGLKFAKTSTTKVFKSLSNVTVSKSAVNDVPCLLSEKYRPRLIHEVLGHQKAKLDLTAWFNHGYINGPVLISGAVGIGKTSLAHAFVQSRNLVVRDVRALPGDFLTTLNNLIYQKNVFTLCKNETQHVNFGLIIDEVHTMDVRERTQMVTMIRERYNYSLEGIEKGTPQKVSGQKKRPSLGCTAARKEPPGYPHPTVCKTSVLNEQSPANNVMPFIILICNDSADKSLDSLKKLCTAVPLYKPYNDENSDVRMLLHRVSKSEKIVMSVSELRNIEECAHGDMRFALNTLQFRDVGFDRRLKRSGAAELKQHRVVTCPSPANMDVFMHSPFHAAALLLTPACTTSSKDTTTTVMCDQSSNTISGIKMFVHENYTSFAVSLEVLIDQSEMISVMDVFENHPCFVSSSLARGISTSLFSVETLRHNFIAVTSSKQKPKLRVPSYFQASSQQNASKTKMNLFMQHRQHAPTLRSCLNAIDWKYVMQHVDSVQNGQKKSANKRKHGSSGAVGPCKQFLIGPAVASLAESTQPLKMRHMGAKQHDTGGELELSLSQWAFNIINN